jgi:hypothetical protein
MVETETAPVAESWHCWVEDIGSRLMPLLSSIVGKQRARERNPNEEDKQKEKASWFPAWNGGGIYSPGGVMSLQ